MRKGVDQMISIHEKAKGRERLRRLLLNLFLLFLVFVIMIPFIWMVSISLRNPADAFRLPLSIFPDDFDITSYISLGSSKVNIPNLYKNSLVITIMIVAAQLITCPIAGYAFARLRFRGKELLFRILLLSLMIPRASTIIPLYIVISKLKLMNTPYAIVLPYVFNAFGVFLFRQSFIPISRSFEEAAYIDGAGIFRTFFSIILPQVKPTFVTLLILTFAGTWNMYIEPLIFLTKIESMTLPIGIVYLRGYMGSGNLSVVMAAVTLAIVPIVIIFIACQRHIVEGLTSGGVKG
jgi:multiple sugar transport system permease protein